MLSLFHLSLAFLGLNLGLLCRHGGLLFAYDGVLLAHECLLFTHLRLLFALFHHHLPFVLFGDELQAALLASHDVVIDAVDCQPGEQQVDNPRPPRLVPRTLHHDVECDFLDFSRRGVGGAHVQRVGVAGQLRVTFRPYVVRAAPLVVVALEIDLIEHLVGRDEVGHDKSQVERVAAVRQHEAGEVGE